MKYFPGANQEIEEAELKIASLRIGGEDDFLHIDENIQRLEQSHQQISQVLHTFRNIKSSRETTDLSRRFSLNNLNESSSVSQQEINMKESPSDYFSDSESSNVPVKQGFSRMFGSFDKGSRRKVPVTKSRSVDIMLNNESFDEDLSKCFQSSPIVADRNQRNNNQSIENLVSNSFNSFDQSEDKSETVEDEIQSLQPNERKIIYIAKEIMTSERSYVDVLKLVNIDFKNFIQDARKNSKSQIIPTEQFLKIFR